MNRYTGAGNQRGGVLATIFALIFIAVGLGIGAFFAKGLFDWIEAKSWQPVPATLLHVDLRSSRSSEGGLTWRVEADYEYEWRGTRQRGDWVDLHPGSDDLGDYHRSLYAELNEAFTAGRPVTAWVDPDQPARAVLNRDMRWGRLAFGMLFPLVFGGAGAGVLIAARHAGRRQRELEQRKSSHPDQPWMWHERWQTAEISSQAGTVMWVAIGFAVFWNLISLPVLFLVPDEIAEGNHIAAVGLLFPAIGIGLIVWAVREVIRRRRYGDSTLRLDALPVPLGGTLRATLEIPARLQGREIEVRVTCLGRYTSGHGKNRKTHETTLWEDRQRVMTRSGSGPGGTSARVEMRLPGDRPVASEDDPDDRIVWQLEAVSDEPGVDFKARFELPVFDIGSADDGAGVEHQPALFEADDWRNTGVRHGAAAGGYRFWFPRFRILGGGLVTLGFALVFGGAGAFMILVPGEWLFGAVFAVVGLPILWAAITMLFSSSEIVIGNGRIRWRHGVFGGRNEAETGAIKAIDIKRSGSIGRNLYFRIELERWGREGKVAIADWVPGERAARSLAAHLSRLAGVGVEEAG